MHKKTSRGRENAQSKAVRASQNIHAKVQTGKDQHCRQVRGNQEIGVDEFVVDLSDQTKRQKSDNGQEYELECDDN
jgi:nitrogen fixation protein FixH